MKGKKLDTYANLIENDNILIGFIGRAGQYTKAAVSSRDDIHNLFVTDRTGNVTRMEVYEFGPCVEIQTEKPIHISYDRSTYLFNDETKNERHKALVFSTKDDVYCMLSTETKLRNEKDENPDIKVGTMNYTEDLRRHEDIANLAQIYPYFKSFNDKRSGAATGRLDSSKLLLYDGKSNMIFGHGVRRLIDGAFLLTDIYFPEIGIESHIQG